MSLISLVTARQVLHEPAGQDEFIQILLDGADDFAERVCGIALTEASRVESMAGGGLHLWPASCPIISVTSIVDQVTDTTLDSGLYALRGNSSIRRIGDNRWELGADRYSVTYVGGYAGTGDSSIAVPGGLKSIVLGLVARAFNNRGGASSERAGDWSLDWQGLAGSDVMRQLARYRMGAAVSC